MTNTDVLYFQLSELPSGMLFKYGDEMVLKTAFRDSFGMIVAYVLGTGERLTFGDLSVEDVDETVVMMFSGSLFIHAKLVPLDVN